MTTTESAMPIETELMAFLRRLGPDARRRYDRGVNRDLSRQQWSGLFQRNVLAVVTQIHDEVGAAWRKAETDWSRSSPSLADSEGKGDGAVLPAAWSVQLLRALDGLATDLVVYALEKHRASCAISNFPDEHRPSADYVDETLAKVHSAQAEFVLSLNGSIR